MLLAYQFDDGFEVFLIGRVEIIQLVAIHIEHQLRFALAISGTTISDLDRLVQAIWPGNWSTSGTSWVLRSRAAAPHTFLERNVNAG